VAGRTDRWVGRQAGQYADCRAGGRRLAGQAVGAVAGYGDHYGDSGGGGRTGVGWNSSADAGQHTQGAPQELRGGNGGTRGGPRGPRTGEPQEGALGAQGLPVGPWGWLGGFGEVLRAPQ